MAELNPGGHLLHSYKWEISEESLVVEGRLPEWLKGRLIRNSPSLFDLKEERYRHFFDGLAMLHRFDFSESAEGKVSYSSRFLKTRSFEKDMASGRVNYQNFASQPAPADRPQGPVPLSDNAPVNVLALNDKCLALSEGAAWWRFEPDTLATLERYDFQDSIDSHPLVMSPHPHFDTARRVFFNYALRFSGQPTYELFYLEKGTGRRKLLCSLPAAQPSYMHSFASTANYLVLSQFPLLLEDARQLAGGARPFIENFKWFGQQPTRFLIISKRFGRVVDTFEAEACFAFHHINAFERDGELFIDLLAYPDPSPINLFYLEALSSPNPPALPASQLRRYRHRPNQPKTQPCEVIYPAHLEMPRLNHSRHSARPYRFVYALGRSEQTQAAFEDLLVKIDLEHGACEGHWQQAGCYPGEPVFVPSPEDTQEDKGIILSVVLDLLNRKSFLVALDALSFQEVARINLPRLLPFGLHGDYCNP
ncbi:MAG TPA: carotenoid oxygenase family protein [Chloroflexia bacterium]|nr:carotenoid oxygenase family protein [Chloroflexia bacterium]